MASMASAKGFDLVEVANDSGITWEFLRQFQVIIWNNNNGGAASVPSSLARQAVLDYLDQGGGWMLIHGAADHGDSWSGLKTVLGTKFATQAQQGTAEMVLDEDALVIATSRVIARHPDVLALTTYEGSGDRVYGWAREVGRGRLNFTPLGHGQNQLMAQLDSVIPRLYRENIRYAAGDFQNGCTRPQDSRFDPAARVHDETGCGEPVSALRDPDGIRTGTVPGGILFPRGGYRQRIAATEGSLRVRVRDLQGARVWERTLSAGTGELALDGAVGAGICHVEIRGATGMVRRRLALP